MSPPLTDLTIGLVRITGVRGEDGPRYRVIFGDKGHIPSPSLASAIGRSLVRIEDMASRKRWNELSLRTRRLIIAAATVEGLLKIAALVDLVRRPAEEVRGSKVRWATAIVVVNSGGALCGGGALHPDRWPLIRRTGRGWWLTAPDLRGLSTRLPNADARLWPGSRFLI